ncbi:hypothetical protein AAG747_20850 [Rapidithrix thailandica]|uniref:Uncharacterized protein n=1 Tax=Rapidithrix thailandica TaxID=413964 RepID=A0AAW9SD01_9BACT
MNPAKFTKSLLCSLLLIFALSSCSKKDPDPVKNEITVDNQTYSLLDGYIIDYGAYDMHYNFDFYIGDSDYDEDKEDFVDPSMIIYIELFSPGTTEFKAGTYEFIASSNSSVDREGKHFFEFGVFATKGESELYVEGGTVKITKVTSEHYFEIHYDLILENGKILKGDYRGELTYFK